MNEKIDEFLKSLEEQGDGRFEIVTKLRRLLTTTVADADEGFKYGGLYYTLDGSPFGGIFAYKNHVSVEMSSGAHIDDPYGFLEGTGGSSGRKHLRLSEFSEIEEKHVAEYLVLAREAS